MTKTVYQPVFPFLPALTLLFVALKLTNVIDWSWFWVLSPLLFVVLIALVVVVGIGGIGLRLAASAKKPSRRLAKILPLAALIAVAPVNAADRPVDHNRIDCRACHRPVRATLCDDDPALIEFRKWLEKRGSYKPVREPARRDRIVIRDSDARKLPDKLEAQQWKNLETIFSK